MRILACIFIVVLVVVLIITPNTASAEHSCAALTCTCDGSVTCQVIGSNDKNTCGPIRITTPSSCDTLYFSLIETCQKQTAEKFHMEIQKISCSNSLICSSSLP